jgi:predicted  nucleic acid-binding Zn-ribbon protein
MLSGCPDCGGNKFQFKPAGATTDESTQSERPTLSEQSTSDPAEQSSRASADSTDAADAGEQPSPDPASTPDSDPSSAVNPTTADSDPSTPADSDPSTTADSDPSTPADSDPSTPADSDSAAAPESTASESTPSEPADSTSGPADSTSGTEHVREREEEDVAQASARSDVVSPDELDQASRPVDSDADADARDSPDSDGPRPDIGELRDELNEQFESIRIVSPGKYELNLMELYDRQEYIISLQEDGRYVIEMPDAWDIQDE